jgi:toluene monooxygenase system ferredoxin subunit
MKRIALGSVDVVLLNADGTVRAYQDRCPHQGVRLSEGRLAGCQLTCRAHEWQFDALTGEGSNPRGSRLRQFKVSVEAGELMVDVGTASSEPRSAVGPVLQSVPASRAIVSAILEENPGATILDRGGYVRVLVPGRCVLTRAVVERHASATFRLPGDLEVLMPSFKGRLTMSADQASWELGT